MWPGLNVPPHDPDSAVPLHSKFCSRIIGEEALSPLISIQRGVLQGAPASPTLFVLTVELLSVALHHNDKIVGVILADCVKIISQFADDGDMYLTASDSSLAEVLHILQKFGQQMGLTLNENKTQVVRLSSLRAKKNFFLPSGRHLNWVDSPFVEVLGIMLATNSTSVNFQNYHKRLDSIFGLVHYWKSCLFSFLGKVLLLKLHIYSHLVYQMQVLPTPNVDFLSQVKTLSFHFLSGAQIDRIKRSTLVGTPLQGGVNLTDLSLMNRALKIAWIPHLLSSNSAWASIVSTQFHLHPHYLFGGNLTWGNFQTYVNCDNLPSFWREVCQFWCDLNYVSPVKI